MTDFRMEKDWITEAGLRAAVLMGSIGARVGYVGLPKGHPLHGVEYNQGTEFLPTAENEAIGKRSVIAAISAEARGDFTSPDMVFDVHGGLTYSGDGDGIYPVPSDLWWFGFDCNHAGDAPSDDYLAEMREKHPDLASLWRDRGGTHRSLDYCIGECESLARQIVQKCVEVQP